MESCTNILIEQKIIPVSAGRPGRKLSGFKGVTIHETANYKLSAGAVSHAQYMAGAGKNNQVSAHYYVDELLAVQIIPEDEVAWHAGDGTRAGGGNLSTIAIEICENWGCVPTEYKGLFPGMKTLAEVSQAEREQVATRFGKALDNAARLAAEILHRHGIAKTEGFLFQHYDWSKKDCPHNIRQGFPLSWGGFVAKVEAQLAGLSSGENNPPQPEKKQDNPAAALYRVQVGAFANRKNAELLLEKLTKDGYPGVIKEG